MMNPQNHKRRQRSKDQTTIDLGHIEFLISLMNPEDQNKIEFVEDFIHKYLIPFVEDDDIITIEPLEYKTFKYLLASLLWKFEPVSKVS